MNLNELLYINNYKFNKELDILFKEFISVFHKYTYNMFLDKTLELNISSIEKFYYIKKLVYTKYPKYINILEGLLDEFGYNYNTDIIDGIKELGKKNNLIDIKKSLSYMKKSSVINDCEFINMGKYEINTKNGIYHIQNINDYLKNNEIILNAYNYVKMNSNQICLNMMKYMDNSKIITSLIPNYFSGCYKYHTYLLDKYNNIIDFDNNIVMNKNEYDLLFNTTEETIISNEDAINEFYNNGLNNFNMNSSKERKLM